MPTAEPCALYYFPEIPCAANNKDKAAKPIRFTSGSFGGGDDQASQKSDPQDSQQIQSLIEEAFNNGLEQGRKETAAAHQERINNAVAAFETGINELHRIRQHDIHRLEAETVRLALAIAKKIVGRETEHKRLIQHVVKQAMEKVTDTRHLVIRLNPNDVETVQDLQQDLLPADDFGSGFRIEADEGIKRGGCVIETKLGDVDARIDRQIKIVEALLGDQLPK